MKKKSLAEQIKDIKRAAPPAPAPVVAPPKPREPTLTKQEREELAALDRSHNDEFFFKRMMSGIQPLGDDKRGRVGNAPKLPKREAKPPPQKDPDDEVRDHLMNLVEGGARFEISDDGRNIEGRRLDLPDSTFRRLRRGELAIDARLDLHGKRADEARDALEKFLKEKRARRDRVVLVIHGRGDHSPAGIGVLRGEIGAWLAQGRASQHVAAFATAHGQDGGEGALYVLLRP
jgi:DNA-nicking Smr family endonuclease